MMIKFDKSFSFFVGGQVVMITAGAIFSDSDLPEGHVQDAIDGGFARRIEEIREEAE